MLCFRYKDVSLRAIKRSFPKTIDFMKIRIYDEDINYEHKIIERFEAAILKTFDTLFENNQEINAEMDKLKEENSLKEKKLETLTELLNTDNSLDRIKASFEQLSSMILSKSFSARLDSKAIYWLKCLYGDKLFAKLTEMGSTRKKKGTRSKSRKRDQEQAVADTKHMYTEILEIISSIVDSPDCSLPASTVSKLDYIKSRVSEVVTKDLNATVRTAKDPGSFFTDVNSPPMPTNVSQRILIDDSSIPSNTSISEFDFRTPKIHTEDEQKLAKIRNLEEQVKFLTQRMKDWSKKNLAIFTAFKQVKREWNRSNDKMWNFKLFEKASRVINSMSERYEESTMQDSDLFPVLKLQAQVIENLDELNNDSDHVESPMEFNLQHHVM